MPSFTVRAPAAPVRICILVRALRALPSPSCACRAAPCVTDERRQAVLQLAAAGTMVDRVLDSTAAEPDRELAVASAMALAAANALLGESSDVKDNDEEDNESEDDGNFDVESDEEAGGYGPGGGSFFDGAGGAGGAGLAAGLVV